MAGSEHSVLAHNVALGVSKTLQLLCTLMPAARQLTPSTDEVSKARQLTHGPEPPGGPTVRTLEILSSQWPNHSPHK